MFERRLLAALKGTSARVGWLLGAGLASALAACSPAAYAVNTTRAERSLAHAKQMRAGDAAPYEIALAQAYLDKAREESSEAEYQDAIRLARVSTSNADKAIARSRQQRQGAVK